MPKNDPPGAKPRDPDSPVDLAYKGEPLDVPALGGRLEDGWTGQTTWAVAESLLARADLQFTERGTS